MPVRRESRKGEEKEIIRYRISDAGDIDVYVIDD